MKEICLEYDTLGKNIDDRRFITFGFRNAFIRRVHQYVVSSLNASVFSNNYGPSSDETVEDDGLHRDMENTWVIEGIKNQLQEKNKRREIRMCFDGRYVSF